MDIKTFYNVVTITRNGDEIEPYSFLFSDMETACKCLKDIYEGVKQNEREIYEENNGNKADDADIFIHDIYEDNYFCLAVDDYWKTGEILTVTPDTYNFENIE